MALFDSMIKPGWQHPDPEVRKAAIAELDDESLLAEIVDTDSDEEIRVQALALISAADVLDKLLDQLDGALQQQAKSQRLAQLLPDPARLADISDDELLLRIASLADDEELRLKAVDQLSDASVRYNVALEHPVARVRLSAAMGISDQDMLHRLLDATQGKDKAIYRYCKDQVNLHKEARQAEADRQKNIEALIDKASRLSSAIDSPEYAGSFRLLQRNWEQASAHANQQQRDKIQLYLKTCAARVADKAEAAAADADRQVAAGAAVETFVRVLDDLKKLKGHTRDLGNGKEVSRLGDMLDESERCWSAALEHARTEARQEEQYKKLIADWRQVHATSKALGKKAANLKKLGTDLEKAGKLDFVALDQLLQRATQLAAGFSWSVSAGAEKPQALARLDDWQGQLTSRLEKLSVEEAQNTRRVEEAMGELRSAIAEGHMKDASRTLNKVQRTIKTLPGAMQKRHEKELRTLVTRLDEIRDWQGFAIEPKKIELCEAMEALAGSRKGGEKLATEIHDLQEQWKQLGPLAPHRDQQLWRRFSTAADKAWEPCKEAFARQAEEREVNLASRMEVIAGLRQYEQEMDWSQSESSDFDWKAVLKQLDDTRASMRAIKPVGQKGAARSEAALKKVSDKVYAHIREEYNRNIQQKEELVERAQKLSEVDSLDQAIDQAKRLQILWKGVGITPVKVDRSQWKKFRSACDAVFKRLDAEKQQQRAEIDAVVDQAEGLVKEAEDMLHAGDDAQRLHVESKLHDVRQAIDALELPKGAQQRLGKRLAQAESRARKVAGETRTRLRESRWQTLFDKIQACATRQDEGESAARVWEQGVDNPRGVDGDLLQVYWDGGIADEDTDRLREICIAAEVLADIESPEGDGQARMAFQVQRLAEGMGKQREKPRAVLVRLINEFIALRPPVSWVERFRGAASQVNL